MLAWLCQNLRTKLGLSFKVIIILFSLLFALYHLPILRASDTKVIISSDPKSSSYNIFCPTCFKSLLYVLGDDKKMHIGTYTVKHNVSFADLRRSIIEGTGEYGSITIKEGETIDDLIQSFSINENISHTNVFNDYGNQLVLLPMTIDFIKGETDRNILQQLINISSARLNNIGNTCRASYKDKFAIIASIIEKESAYQPEYPYIAAVLYNRLRLGMPLQVDVYPKSYKHRGLPSSMIASPSLAALKAACMPATVNWLYYVANNDGKHIFSENFADHQFSNERRKNVYKY